jgi:hypothetical protein
VLVYDVNSQKTFEDLDTWRDEFLIQVRPWARTGVQIGLTACLCRSSSNVFQSQTYHSKGPGNRNPARNGMTILVEL